MQKYVTATALAIALLGAVPSVTAQSATADLPRVSPQARLVQRTGLTHITTDCHRQSVYGQTLFGSLEA